MNKKFAFTLTEVLVTLSIIGVVSALTVPTLMNQYQRKAQAVQIRKSANEIMSAIDMLTTEEGKTTFKKQVFLQMFYLIIQLLTELKILSHNI